MWLNLETSLDELEDDKKFSSDRNFDNNNNNNNNDNSNDINGNRANRRVIIDQNMIMSNPNDVEIASLKGVIY